jgi:peptidoglycan hydrolase-like protein with peptidoglycan-binding domain
MRTLFALGARGDLVREIQQNLTQRGFSPGKLDGDYGPATAGAVRQFQSANAQPQTGSIDEAAWTPLMDRPVPSVSDRSLQLTSAFEGHGFGLAVGNFDGALLTWGIIGFTLASGEIQKIVLSISRQFPEVVRQAFGDYTADLLQLMQADRDFQTQWANAHTVNGRALAEPWKSMFAAFGAAPQVQAEQLKRVQAAYMQPAIQTAHKLGFTSELGLALCFDIHVQNGGIKSTTMDEIAPQLPGLPEADARVLVANAVADSARPQYCEDVRSRKLAIATGSGNVHGRQYDLANWGLDGAFAAGELAAQPAPA